MMGPDPPGGKGPGRWPAHHQETPETPMQTGPKPPTSKRSKEASPGRWALLAGMCWRRPGPVPPPLNHEVHPPPAPSLSGIFSRAEEQSGGQGCLSESQTRTRTSSQVPAGWGPAPLRARRLLQSVIYPEQSPETGARGHVQNTASGRVAGAAEQGRTGGRR